MTPLSILDLVPVSAGSTAAEAVRNTLDLAQRAEALGYRRYWFAEHHLNPGVAGVDPAVVIALTAAATERIRVGSAGVQLAHRTPLNTVEEFGLLDAAYPGRIDLGIGRSGPQLLKEHARRQPKTASSTTDSGLLIPASPALRTQPPAFSLFGELLQQPGAQSPDYGTQIEQILALLDGTFTSTEGVPVQPVPGTGARPELWILGASSGQSAAVAGKNGLRFAASYHIAPTTALDAVAAYRAAFQPSEFLDRPYVSVSADVVVAPTEAEARELAAGYALWVLGIRRGRGAQPFPSPAEVAGHEWTEEDRALVADRIDTQFVGTAAQVAERLRQLQRSAEADELVVTTITHAHADRVRSQELLAAEWF
ncbi:LLM class flavin-dependent oxidoreductase [Pseudonocardiaceae bacterium YIM PH 21723]|nr:LLM class flavin-dependent oxidoreductase [Pseudonocardiaceae bacterium YIM PH 21723]